MNISYFYIVNSSERSILITVRGLIQGVGFRPFIYRLATKTSLSGWVRNTNENVQVRVEGNRIHIDRFLKKLASEAPPASLVGEIFFKDMVPENFSSFTIRESDDISDEITGISPDIAVCGDCLHDMTIEGSRKDYAFVNCTNCGPRFTIIKDLPYDRMKTTMASFPLCPECKKEYGDIEDRRFHAQPVACSICGPAYTIHQKGIRISSDIHVVLSRARDIIESGGLLAMKGLGGMHLACDPFNDKAVEKLRKLKCREGKPFAIMFCDAGDISRYAYCSRKEKESLESWRRPIILLTQKVIAPIRVDHSRKPSGRRLFLSPAVTSGLTTIGIMLPYMPFHHLLFRNLNIPALVMTSGNFSNEPIIMDNETALEKFSQVTDGIILHNRDIQNRADDPVVRIIGGKERVMRRSRGYVPIPVQTNVDVDGIIAFGAELANCFCVGKGRKAILSQHIGDLRGLETTLFYEETLQRFLQLFRVRPALIAVDMHPDYISTRVGKGFCGLPVVEVQHHHAHIAACMAEYSLDEKVIGVAFDGTGYGTDGHTWGAEFMVCDLADFRRVSHFGYVPLPGGDLTTEEPWRMAVSYLYTIFGNDLVDLDLPFLRTIDREKMDMLITMMGKKINCPLVSSAGRLFDAVSALIGLCNEASFSAEGPMRLESIIVEGITGKYTAKTGDAILFNETFREIVKDVISGLDASLISTKFHNTIISVIFESVKGIRAVEGINKVVLSGGVFQNKYLLSRTEKMLRKDHFNVFAPCQIPPNDGGVALGQLIIAAKRRELKCV